jgi:hypothetical protein
LVALLFMLQRWAPTYADRFITPWQLTIYAVGCLSNHVIAVQSFYVLSRRAPPLVVPASISFLLAAIGVFFGGWYFGNTGALLGYSAVMTLVAVPMHSLAYQRFRRLTT